MLALGQCPKIELLCVPCLCITQAQHERYHIKIPFSLLTPSKTRKDKKKKKERKDNQAGDNRNRLARRGSFLYLPDSWLMGAAKEGSGACVPALGSSLLPSKVCKKHA